MLMSILHSVMKMNQKRNMVKLHLQKLKILKSMELIIPILPQERYLPVNGMQIKSPVYFLAVHYEVV